MPERTDFGFTSADWAQSRFARSGLWEAFLATRTLTDPRMQGLHSSWLASLDRRAVAAQLPTLLALNPRRGWVPVFLVPPPQPELPPLEHELAAIAQCPLDLVRADIRRCLGSNPTSGRAAVLTPLLDDPRRALEVITAELATAWDLLIAPIWPRIRDILDADIEHRSAVIARHGLGAAMADIHVTIRRTGDTVSLDNGVSEKVRLSGDGLTLLPSAFTWPNPIAVHDPPWTPTIAYPARGIAEIWTARPQPSAPLAKLLGATRATLLLDLTQFRSTTELAGRHYLTPATVSEHLAVLFRTGLLIRRRDGRQVRYRTTPLARALTHAER